MPEIMYDGWKVKSIGRSRVTCERPRQSRQSKKYLDVWDILWDMNNNNTKAYEAIRHENQDGIYYTEGQDITKYFAMQLIAKRYKRQEDIPQNFYNLANPTVEDW